MINGGRSGSPDGGFVFWVNHLDLVFLEWLCQPTLGLEASSYMTADRIFTATGSYLDVREAT